jgi:hypothetical protein
MFRPMNSKLILMAVAVIAAFGITAVVVVPATIAAPALAQNMTGDMGGNMTADNMTAGNMTGMGGTPTG